MHLSTQFRLSSFWQFARRSPLFAFLLVQVGCLVVLTIGSQDNLQAQIIGGGAGPTGPGGQYPSDAYYQALAIYRDGDLENALRGFEVAEGRTRTDVNGKWLDSIPVRAMLAECYWHLGHLPACRLQVEEAMKIAIRHRGWISSVDFASVARGGAVAAPESNLWPEARNVRRIPLPRQMSLYSGQAVTEQSLAQGGVIETPNIKTIDAIEILRGLAILSHRRRVLLGPLADQDPMAAELLEATRLPKGLNIQAARTLLYATRTAEYFGVADDKAVIDRAGKYATIGGAVHPMTPLLLLCGLKVGAGGDDRGVLPKEAAGRLVATGQQITNAAAALEQYEWIGEALQVSAGVASDEQLLVVENTALMAARTLVRRSRLASLHCYLVAADAAVSQSKLDIAAQHLQAAIAIAGRRDVSWPRLEAYGAYIAARLAAAGGQPIGYSDAPDMSTALRSMSDFILNRRDRNRPIISMPWNLQTEIVLSRVGRGVGNQTAKSWLEAYSSGVPSVLWRLDPLDAMAAVYADDRPLHAVLLNVAAMENDGAAVLKQTDRLLAARLGSVLPLQGRLLQLRTLASSPAEDLWPSSKAALAMNVPMLTQLRERTQASLIVPAQPQAGDVGVGIGGAAAAGVSVRSDKAAREMEAALSGLALARMPVPEINPPRVVNEDVAKLDKQTALITFFLQGGKVFVTVTRNGATRGHVVPAAQRLPAMINRLLQDIGASRNRGKRIDPTEPPSWWAAAAKINSFLFPESSGWSLDGIERVIIVPDGPLWYVPFEILPEIGPMVAQESNPKMWVDQVGVSYAPTPGFALRDVAAATAAERVAMVTGRFFDPRSSDANQAFANEVLASVRDPLQVTTADAPPTDRLGLEIGHLVVAAALSYDVKNPMNTPIVPVDPVAGRSSGKGDWDRLRDWIRFPAGGPRSVLLLGHRSSAATTNLGDGGDLFFPMATLRAAGVKNVLLSRWATGGQSAATYAAEVVGELPHTSLGEASGRGVMMLRASAISPATEPLLGKADEDNSALTGEHPLFWSTYLGSESLHLSPPDSED